MSYVERIVSLMVFWLQHQIKKQETHVKSHGDFKNSMLDILYMNMPTRSIDITILRKGRSWRDYTEQALKDELIVSNWMHKIVPTPQNRIVVEQ